MIWCFRLVSRVRGSRRSIAVRPGAKSPGGQRGSCVLLIVCPALTPSAALSSTDVISATSAMQGGLRQPCGKSPNGLKRLAAYRAVESYLLGSGEVRGHARGGATTNSRGELARARTVGIRSPRPRRDYGARVLERSEEQLRQVAPEDDEPAN